MYLLDTCLVSELIRAKPNKNVMNWIESLEEEMFYLSVLTLGEIQKGISKLSDRKRRSIFFEWLENDLIARFEGRILPITVDVAVKWGEISVEAEKRGFKLPVVDTLIAATAIVSNFMVVTRNIDDLQKAGAKVINPWGL